MNLDELKEKIQRMYSSVEEARELDLSKFRPKYVPHGHWVRVHHDFQGDWTPTRIKRVAFGVIRDIADLKDYLASAARVRGQGTTVVDETIRQNFELQLIIDLANYDKHSAHNRKTWSGKAPRLRNVKRVFELKGTMEPSRRLALRLGRKGIESTGGEAAVVISGDIVGKGGEHLSTLSFCGQKSIEAWQSLIRRFGLAL